MKRKIITWTLVEQLKKTMEHEGDVDTNCDWSAQNNPKRIGKVTGGLGKKRTSGEHPNNSIVEIGQNIWKSPGDSPVRNHQLTLVWKTLKTAK